MNILISFVNKGITFLGILSQIDISDNKKKGEINYQVNTGFSGGRNSDFTHMSQYIFFSMWQDV